jgi:protein TonB
VVEQQTAMMRALAAVGRSRWRALAALSMSLLMHVGVAYAIWINDAELGRTSRVSDAISANAVHSIVIETVFEDAREAAANQASVASLKGIEAPDKTEPVPDAEPAAFKPEPLPFESLRPLEEPAAQPPDPEPRPDAPIEAADLAVPALDVTSDDTAGKVQDEERRVRDAHAKAVAERKKADAQPRKTKSASNADSSASRGHEKAARSGGNVSASQGDIMSYAAQVRARVAGNKPSGSGGRGTVVIGFGVSRGGGLAFARVARSSGSSSLDQVALAAVRGAGPFPMPPAGATPGQLTFSIPFHFN